MTDESAENSHLVLKLPLFEGGSSGLVCRENTVLKEENTIIDWVLQEHLTTNYCQSKLTNLLIDQLINEVTMKTYCHCFSTFL
jgi:hypothetical protein